MKLTVKQTEALEWLSTKPWATPWWGGKPATEWPKELPAGTYNSLSLKHLIATKRGIWSESIVCITNAGREAIKAER